MWSKYKHYIYDKWYYLTHDSYLVNLIYIPLFIFCLFLSFWWDVLFHNELLFQYYLIFGIEIILIFGVMFTTIVKYQKKRIKKD